MLLLIGVIPALVVSTVAYITIRDSLQDKTIDQLNSTTIKQVQKIDTILQSRQEEAAKLANQYDLQVSLRSYMATSTAANKAQLALILQNKKIEVPEMQSAFLTDLDGKLIASSSTNTMSDTKIQAPASGEESVVTVARDPVDGFTKLFVTHAVSINKQRSALITVAFRTDEIIAIVQDYTGLGQTGETIVVTTNDNISLFPLRFDTDASLKANLSDMTLGVAKNERYEVATDYRQQNVFVVAHAASLSNWVVAAKIDESEALTATTALRNSLTGITLSISVGIVLVALFLGQLFARPILVVARIAERIGRGDFTARTSIKRKDELGTLADSVNAMGTNLQDMVGNIESQRMRLQVILDSTTETIFAIDEQANIILVNQSVKGLLQQSPEWFVGKNMQNIFSWKHGLQPFTVSYDVEGVHTYSNLQFDDTTGAQRYVKLIVSRIRDERHAGNAHAIVTIHDETSTHELENMKTDFVSMAAHELRTPLSAVRGYLEMVQYKQERKDTEDVDAYVRQALKNVADLGGLINNLLDVTRIERGTLTLNMEKVDVAADIAMTVEGQRFAAEDRQLTLTRHGPDKDCFVVGDPVALREITDNLLANAIKYTKPNGKIDVFLSKVDDNYVIQVKDTGIGIPDNAQKHLFTKFYRVHGGLDSGSTGTGLGLFIARSIAERHKGTIAVTSKPGDGSTFTVTLPVYSDKRLAEMRPTGAQDTATDNVTIRRKRGWITKNIAR
jgi:PAS domain S-box-containing protein